MSGKATSKNKYGKKPKLRCLAYYPRDAEGDGGRCCLPQGHDGKHRTSGSVEWIEFSDAHAEWLHPNTNGKDARISELMDALALEKKRAATWRLLAKKLFRFKHKQNNGLCSDCSEKWKCDTYIGGRRANYCIQWRTKGDT